MEPTAAELRRALHPRKKPRSGPEASLVKATMDLLAAMGCRAYRRNVGVMKKGDSFVRFNRVGMSDVWAIAPNGRHIEIELKSPGEKPSDEQRNWLLEVAAANALAFWSDDIDDLREKLQEALR